MSELQINNFSLISRLFGNLFYRSPEEPVLEAVFHWLQQKGLEQVWALDVDDEVLQALESIQMPIAKEVLAEEYYRLFLTDMPKVDSKLSSYGIDVNEFMSFRQERGMPAVESADHFALLLLTASWIEDNIDSINAQRTLFESFLLPCASKFLTKVESHASLPFYRSLALLTREILAAMADELEES
ncbi:TorD/DmsD family molecular chaperone [Mannheimia massilioguelmaensis]|uniref:TorD/DmsD family molecular chaperone n=1 Tax=Mannheimia massilioguelmaensis TaxID=1604354 RepID=UPI0005C9FEE2|nr:molecular chaperone [Mannheimia massilioguelmaensis]